MSGMVRGGCKGGTHMAQGNHRVPRQGALGGTNLFFLVQTWASWQSPLTRYYSRELSDSGIRAVQCRGVVGYESQDRPVGNLCLTPARTQHGRVLKKSGPASQPAKRHFGTIWVYCGEHPGITHNFKCTLSSISKQAESTQIRCTFCASRRARVLKKSVPASCTVRCWAPVLIWESTPTVPHATAAHCKC